MSKTDKTDPWLVQKARYGVIEHNHEDGVCNGDQVKSWRDLSSYGECTKELPDSWWKSRGYTESIPRDMKRTDQHQRRQADRKAMQDAKYNPEDWEDTVPVNHRHSTFGGGYWD